MDESPEKTVIEKQIKEQPNEEFQTLVRFLDRDIDGKVKIYVAIARVRGCSFMISNAVCKLLGLDKTRKIGDFNPAELKKLEEFIQQFSKQKIPSWLLNRRKDNESGEDNHLVSSDLDFIKKSDIQFLKKIKCYRGVRHARGDKKLKVKVRGQRTRSTGRKKGGTVGVSKKKA